MPPSYESMARIVLPHMPSHTNIGINLFFDRGIPRRYMERRINTLMSIPESPDTHTTFS